METVTFIIAIVFIYGLAILCTLVDWKHDTVDFRNTLNSIFRKETNHE